MGEEKFAVFFIIFLDYKAISLPIFYFEFCGFGLIKKIKINRVSTLIVPNGLKNLKMALPNIAKIMESNK